MHVDPSFQLREPEPEPEPEPELESEPQQPASLAPAAADLEPQWKAGWEIHTSQSTGHQYYFQPTTGASTYGVPPLPTPSSAEAEEESTVHESPTTTQQEGGDSSITPSAGAAEEEAAGQEQELRRALAEIAYLVAEHPENVELRDMILETTSALSKLEGRRRLGALS